MARRTPLVLFVLLLSTSAIFAADVPAMPSQWDIPCTATELEPKATLFNVAEQIPYAVRWGVIKAGRGLLTFVGEEPIDGRPAYHVALEIGTTGVTRSIHRYFERMEAWIDKESLLTLRMTKATRQKKYERDESIVFDQACGRYYRYEKRLDKGTEEKQQGKLPPNTVDIVGYLLYLRSLPLAVGQNFDLTLLSGDKLYPVTVQVVRRTKISGPSGWHDTFFLEPKLKPTSEPVKLRDLHVWITADEKKLPVRLKMELKVGSIMAEMVATDKR